MMPRPVLVTGFLLAISILTFGGLAYQTVTTSTTQATTQASTETLVTYSQIAMIDTLTYTTTGQTSVTQVENNGNDIIVYYYSYTQVVQSPYVTESVTTMQSIQPFSITKTMTATGVEPAYASLGLDGNSFITLTALTIAAFGLLMLYFARNNRTRHDKQIPRYSAQLSPLQRITPSPVTGRRCLVCANELRSNSKFCNKCGNPVS
jgi:hypothetical protein